ncbi:hypothetical protein FHS83_003503 [Rhizomicrobium palustre]|uniref:Uncharacterized protein n=1 Tax=Rhizomicrobium palustre TaxID=189966 RepID=A0A846N3Z9_9PROT|nr:hypothetical protein [Rhizomicrobium palustre]NIK90185.1 hypothetical protein [Rhizomicrobium palustre]
MRGSAGLGLAIAAIAAAGVFGVTLFGDKPATWFERAAQAGAVRCLTGASCVQVTGEGKAVKPARPALSADSRCAKKKNWHARSSLLVPIVMCTDERSYLYHMGRFEGAGAEQWMLCAKPDCAREAALFAVK